MIYFDNAATSFPKSKSVINAVTEAMRTCGNAGRSGHEYALKAAEIVYECRKKVASLFNTRPECVVFTSSATEALNIAVKGTNHPGGVTLVSSMEHNSVMRPLNTLRRNGLTVLKQFLVDVKYDHITCENFSAVSNSVTNVVLTHASNVCGKILPVRKLRSLCDEETVFILDASQTAGHFKIDITELGVDIMCIPAHKGLYGPMGVGVLVINPYSDVVIDPLIEGGTGINSKSLEMPEIYPERLEAGTANVGGIAGFLAAINEIDYSAKEMDLFKHLLSGMRNMDNITLYGIPEPGQESEFVPVVLFNKEGYDSEILCDELAQKGFALRAGFHCAPNAHITLGTSEIGGIRLSLGRGNTHREIDRFLNVISEI